MSQVPPLSCVLPLLFAIGLSGACGPPDLGPAVAIPTLELNRAQVPLGGPIEMTYGFTPSPEIRTLTEPYRVSVHFLDADGELMFTDDHDPAVPTTDWYLGQLVTYDRRLFIPVYPYVGDASIALGLYSPATGRRFALAGEHIGDAGHAVVATIELTPPPEGIFLEFREGWHQREFDDDQEWQWSAGDGIVAFGNPRQDSILYLELDGRSDLFDAPQRVDLVVGDRTVDSFVVEASDVTFHTATLSAADFGDDDTIELTLHVDQTFVPAELPDAGNADTRRLGVRVFNLFLERR